MAAAIFAVKAGVKGLPIFRLALAIAAGAVVYFGVMAAMGLRWRRRPVAR